MMLDVCGEHSSSLLSTEGVKHKRAAAQKVNRVTVHWEVDLLLYVILTVTSNIFHRCILG